MPPRGAVSSEQLITWLNDAYSMERGLVPVLERQARDVEPDLPDAAARIRQHITETEHHAERVAACLHELGTGPSTLKSTLASMLGRMDGVSTGLFPDQLIKDAVAGYATEHFEQACYAAIALLARDLGYESVAERCEANMREDAQMARWFEDQLPAFVREAQAKAARR